MKTLVYNKSTKTFSDQDGRYQYKEEDWLREYGLIPYELTPIRGSYAEEGHAHAINKIIKDSIKHTKTVNEFYDDYHSIIWNWKEKMQEKDGCRYRVVMRGNDNKWMFTR